jgi:hypothetical protein
MTSPSVIPEVAAAYERWAGTYGGIGPNGTPVLAAAILREGLPSWLGAALRFKVQGSAREG